MALTYSELNGLQGELIAAADADARTDDELLRHATFGTRGMRDAVTAQLAAKIAARLHHHHGNQLIRQLCRGALILALGKRDEARDILPFVVQLVQRASHASPAPTSVTLSESAAASAREYFQSYLDRPGRIDAITTAAHEFVCNNDSMAGGLLFARFMSDLEFLRRVLADATRSETHRKAAAGALTYFVQTHDAVSDDLGVAGMLDDAYIAQLASEQIDPSRRTKTAIVDTLLARWPFLARMRVAFESEEHAQSEWSPSEFVLLNLALGFGQGGPQHNAIVLPSVGVLPSWLGVLGSFGALDDTKDGEPMRFRPEAGDLVAVANHEDEAIEVLGYFQPPGGHHEEPAPPDSARLVKLKYRPRSKKSGGPPVERWRPVEFLDACVPSSARGRRRTALPRTPGEVDLGPLERLFGLNRPLRLDRVEERIVVVAALGTTREFLVKANIFERPLLDLIPCGRVVPQSHEVEWWSPRRSGDLPVLIVARDLAEAASVVSRYDLGEKTTIVVGIEKQEWDAAALRQLGRTRVLAVVPGWHTDPQDTLCKLGFTFLDWTSELESTVARRPSTGVANDVDEYERTVRRQLAAKLSVEAVHLPSVEAAFGSLKALSTALRREYDEQLPASLAKWSAVAQSLFFQMSASPVRLAGAQASRITATLDDLERQVGISKRQWSESCATSATSHLEMLQRLSIDLHSANPKERALEPLLARTGVVVRCASTHWQELRHRFPHAVPWLDDGTSSSKPAIVFHWPGWAHVERWLIPPIGDPTYVVFYGWEREGLQRAQAARSERVARHWSRQTRLPAWEPEPLVERALTKPLAGDVPIATVEDWMAKLQRRGVIAASLSNDDDDPLVEAVPVYFTGGRYALYTQTFQVHIATNVNTLATKGEERLRERPATALRPGDVVVLRSGAERDAIRRTADSRLPLGARPLARAWHRALRRLRDRLPSDRAVHGALSEAGCTKTEFTTLGWLRSEDQIGPHDDADVDFIAKASADPDLLRQLEDCKAAIHLVRGEHHRASHELFVRALEEVRARLQHGAALDDTIDLGDKIQLQIVDRVDDQIVLVARSATNHSRELP